MRLVASLERETKRARAGFRWAFEARSGEEAEIFLVCASQDGFVKIVSHFAPPSRVASADFYKFGCFALRLIRRGVITCPPNVPPNGWIR